MKPVLIDLETAVAEIFQIVDQRERESLASPFFFIVGAGISSPPIALASAIEEQCRKEAARYRRLSTSGSSHPLDTYSHWFEQAYPSAESRQRYLRRLMENKSISRANFRLAHILLNKRLAHIVVTPNFDDFLSRALSLFGQRPIISDHPKTFDRISPESSDVQIVHVHGSYWFYDCCNLRGEIADRANLNSSQSIRSRLGDILHSRSPIVVGYSGWDGDVITTSLRDRLSEKLGTDIYWFCFRRSEVDRLPPWLKTSGVKFVVPPEAIDSTSVEANSDRAKSRGPYPDRLDVLAATDVFDKFIKRFDIPPPPLTEDPLGFFVQQLRDTLLLDNASETGDDVYALQSVVERLERLRKLEEQHLKGPAEIAVEGYRDAIRRSDYAKALDITKEIGVTELDETVLRELMKSTTDSFMALSADRERYMAGVRFVLTCCEELKRRGKLESFDDFTAGIAKLSQAFMLGQLGDREEEKRLNASIAAEYANRTETIFDSVWAGALFNLALEATNEGDTERGIKIYDELLDQLAETQNVPAIETYCRALLNRSEMCSTAEDPQNEKAVQLLELLKVKSKEVNDPDLQDLYTRGSLLLINRLRRLNRFEPALAEADELISHCDRVQELLSDSKGVKIRAGVMKVIVQHDLGQLEAASATLIWAESLASTDQDEEIRTLLLDTRAMLETDGADSNVITPP